MTLQRIDLLTEPAAVGRWYLVPTVEYVWMGRRDAWPVLGPRHNDADHLRFPASHYHVDARFLSARRFRQIEEECAVGIFGDERPVLGHIAGSPLSYKLPGRPRTREMSTAEADAGQYPHPAPVWKRLLMKRDAPFPRVWVEDHKRAGNFRSLFAAFAGQTAARGKHGLICPHKKFSLGGVPPDADGIVTCPLHGLRICVATGEVEPKREGVAP